MNFLNNLNISKKLIVGFTVIVTVVAVMCAAVFVSVMSIRSAVAANEHVGAQIDAANAVLTSRVERQNALRGLVASGDPSFLKLLKQHEDEYQADIASWEKLAPEDASTINALKAAVADVEVDENALIPMAQDPTKQADAMSQLLTKGRIFKVRELHKAFLDKKEAEQRKHAATLAGTQAFAITLLAVGSLLSVVLSIVMGALLSNGIAKPVTAMTNAMARLAEGDNDVEVPAVGRKDEVGRMAAAVQTFKEAAIE
ncbi:MAG TPA: HAMP domain-containing protein, partial [Phenylobacterium sp.]|nr:HAMP domain-containing protein [Phenylobacterium sp.]